MLHVSVFDDEGAPWTGPIPALTFNSVCVAQGRFAWLESPVVDGYQVAQAYVAQGCSGSDQITASFQWNNTA